MLADTMMPEAYEHGGKLVGVVTTLGFAVALVIDQLD
jgi:ZIP family zinc transporter